MAIPQEIVPTFMRQRKNGAQNPMSMMSRRLAVHDDGSAIPLAAERPELEGAPQPRPATLFFLRRIM